MMLSVAKYWLKETCEIIMRIEIQLIKVILLYKWDHNNISWQAKKIRTSVQLFILQPIRKMAETILRTFFWSLCWYINMTAEANLNSFKLNFPQDWQTVILPLRSVSYYLIILLHVVIYSFNYSSIYSLGILNKFLKTRQKRMSVLLNNNHSSTNSPLIINNKVCTIELDIWTLTIIMCIYY